LNRATVEIVADPQPQIGTPVEEGLEVQVVDMETQKPIPNAFVLLMDVERMEADSKIMPDLQKLGMEYLAHRYGIQYATDGNGRTKIPVGEERRLFLAAKTDGAFGAQNVDTETEELVTIAIGPTSVSHAHVVDSNGNPAADVSVFLAIQRARGNRPFLQAKTNADGLAELRIHVVDEDNNPIAQNYLCVPEIAPGRSSNGESSHRILTRKAGMELLVSAIDKRTVSLLILPTEETVVLKEGYPIEIRVDNLSALPGGYFLAGQLMKAGPEGAASKTLWLGSTFTLESGTASIACPDAGDLYVRLQVAEYPAEDDRNPEMAMYGGRRIRSQTYHSTRLQVQDVEMLQTFTISIDEEELAATLEYWANVQKR